MHNYATVQAVYKNMPVGKLGTQAPAAMSAGKLGLKIPKTTGTVVTFSENAAL